jgi:hypothetical protein
LWEVAYLRNSGLSLQQIIEYRTAINAMTVSQMTRDGFASQGVTSRNATLALVDDVVSPAPPPSLVDARSLVRPPASKQ